MNTARMTMWTLSLIVPAIILGVTDSQSLASGRWRQKANIPTPRVALSASVVNGKIYAIGGRLNPGSGQSRVGTVEEYDPATDQWARKASMPTGRYDLATAVVNGKIYAIGGFPGGPATGIVEVYDPVTDTWARKTDVPTPRSTLGACAVDGRVYTVGGGESSLVEIYDPATDTWSRGADMPTPRHPSISVVDGKIYAIGGLGTAPNWPALSVVEMYDPGTDQWVRRADMPTRRDGFSTAVVDGKIYAVGGASDGFDAPVLPVGVYDPKTDTWGETSPMSSRRIEVSACALDSRIYALGGFAVWSSPFRQLEVLDLTPIVDFNGDGALDVDDLLRLIEGWGLDDPSLDIAPSPWGDGVVDALDVEVFMGLWDQELDDPTLAACWELDEAEGEVAHDSAGGNDALVIGDLLWEPEGGQIGGALGLNGVNDHAIAESVLDPADGPFSVFAWVAVGAPGQVVVSQTEGADWLMADALTGALATGLVPPVSRSAVLPLVSQAAIVDGSWHRIGFTWDGTVRSLYVDNVLVAQDIQTSLSSSIGSLHLGADASLEPGRFWAGLIDDVRIYDRLIRP